MFFICDKGHYHIYKYQRKPQQVGSQEITAPSQTAGDGNKDRDWRLVKEVLDLGHRDHLMRMNHGNRDLRESMDEDDDA